MERMEETNMSKKTTKRGDATSSAGTTRRKFLLTSAAGAGAVVTAIGANTDLFGQVANIRSIRIPKEIPDSLNEAPKPGSFEGRGMTGAEVFAKLCKEEEL